MSWYSFRPYVTASERRRQAAKAAQKMIKGGRQLAPIEIQGRAIASTFWGKSWCSNLETYSDYANRLPRGRTYARNGSVIDLQIAGGTIEALVQGSELYRIAIRITALSPSRWKQFKTAAAGKVSNLLDLLQGRLGKDLLTEITDRDRGLFPAPREIELECSCPDWAGMCKHVAAVLYGVGARLDTRPELFFTLRGVDMQELITASADAVAPLAVTAAANAALAAADLSEVFGVEIESAPAPATASIVSLPATKVRVAATKARRKEPNTAKAVPPQRASKPRKENAATRASSQRERQVR